jgi:ABC-type thiamine transport system ATPase subunit
MRGFLGVSDCSMKKRIHRSIEVAQTPRVLQMSGMFDVPPTERSERVWDVEICIPETWSVGVIVGASGDGKSTIAGEFFGDKLVAGHEWPGDKSILDGFPAAMSIKDITGMLSSVGFSSPLAWLRPFRVLSNGQQFRVNLARTLAEATIDKQMKVVDEYSSVVDRTVAQIGSAAVAKTVRRYGLQFVAVTCHADVIDWLEPCWVYDVARNELQTSGGNDASRGSVRRWERPPIELKIIRADRSAWDRFKPHHYLSGDLHKGAACFVGLVKDQPAVFTAVLHFPHPTNSGWREHRTVCLPDFQGVGIGNAMSEHVASLYAATGKPYTSTTSSPAMIRHRMRSPHWRMKRKPGLATVHRGGASTGMRSTGSHARITASFEYVGPANDAAARRLHVVNGFSASAKV